MPRRNAPLSERLAQDGIQPLGRKTVTAVAGSTVVLTPNVNTVDLGANVASNGTVTLPNGTEGQRLSVSATTGGGAGDAVLTPTNTLGFTSISFDAVGETAHLLFAGGKWRILGVYGATVA